MFVGILQISGTGKYLQCAVYLYGEMLEVTAELIDVERFGAAQSVAHRHLVVVVYLLVNLAYVVFFGEGVCHSFAHYALVGLGV